MTRARVGVLLSGRGSNMVALHEAITRGEVPAEIVLVLSNKANAPGLEKAAGFGLATAAIAHRGLDRRTHEDQVIAALRSAGVEWVCLAGYMRLLTAEFIAAFPQRILNVHPSLLPSFPGLDAQKQAFEHGVRIAGCTVHLVDEALDSGPIVVQRAVEVLDDDTPASLSERILEEEHRAYPEAMKRLLKEKWQLEGRCLRFAGPASLKSSDISRARG